MLTDRDIKSFKELDELKKAKTKQKLEEINLSQNMLSDGSGLEGCLNLRILILDQNGFSTFANFPILIKLDTLSVNANKFANLEQCVKFLSAKVRPTH